MYLNSVLSNLDEVIVFKTYTTGCKSGLIRSLGTKQQETEHLRVQQGSYSSQRLKMFTKEALHSLHTKQHLILYKLG